MRIRLLLPLLALAGLLLFSYAQAAPGVSRVSVDSVGNESDGLTDSAVVSADGNFVAMSSVATNLVGGDANGVADIFLHDRPTGATTRVSVDSGGGEANGTSAWPAVSSDGDDVAFASLATNLVASDTNDAWDVFVHDGAGTTRVSVDSVGTEADAASFFSSISGDGNYVAFYSAATNLVAGDTNGSLDVFVHNRTTGVTERVSVDSGGGEGNMDSADPSISSDGRYVAFASQASNLVAGDTNGSWDVFVHDRDTGTTSRASVASGGAQGGDDSWYPAISGDGDYVAFESLATNLVAGDSNGVWDVFVRNLATGATSRVSVSSASEQAGDSSYGAAISSDGQYVVFASLAGDLSASDTTVSSDIFVRDRTAGTTSLVSVDSGGDQGDSHSYSPTISGDGLVVAFVSEADDLVAGDTNGQPDAFANEGLISAAAARTPCGTDTDCDGFADAVETYVGTDPLDNCSDDAADAANPLDMNNSGIITTGDVGPYYRGKIPLAVENSTLQRLDLNVSGTVTIADTQNYRGKIPSACE